MERFACPTADRMGRYHCIDDHVLCDGFVDCPTGEDEDRQACLFYKTVSRITMIAIYISVSIGCIESVLQVLKIVTLSVKEKVFKRNETSK